MLIICNDNVTWLNHFFSNFIGEKYLNWTHCVWWIWPISPWLYLIISLFIRYFKVWISFLWLLSDMWFSLFSFCLLILLNIYLTKKTFLLSNFVLYYCDSLYEWGYHKTLKAMACNHNYFLLSKAAPFTLQHLPICTRCLIPSK